MTRSPLLAVLLVLAGACATPDRPADPPAASIATANPTTSQSPATGSLAAATRLWEASTGDLFKRSARALQKVSEASDAGDDAAVRSGCVQLHDANAVELQRLLPTPDPELTAELQRMIDDLNIATYACLRFVIAREPGDSSTYQDYLARAVGHLHQSKVLLDADLHKG